MKILTVVHKIQSTKINEAGIEEMGSTPDQREIRTAPLSDAAGRPNFFRRHHITPHCYAGVIPLSSRTTDSAKIVQPERKYYSSY